ncbi:hypothetical protein HGI30_17920 [Paenibacillus albicereus]|uniref:Butirosin biosynthesis protein H N-terminal domain-containing protein n=1 Tax=Paenibacillus albicereus TaxID=2726185 RepID=A0A6H2H0T6_9BACL|nr:hypothetical protein [Paenibacillus albicereus]QJC53267.1 hypothetical protein HGI30_17920 [Paenibacillus albicereus]
MAERLLPIRYPFVTTYPQPTNLMAMLSMHEEFYPWFYSNHIQLKCSRKPYALDLLIYPDNVQRVCPVVDYEQLSRATLGRWFPSFLSFVQSCIDDGRYVQATVNSYYIQAYPYYYRRYHRFHEIFLFGYDSVREVVHAADFFEGGKYEFREIPYAELEQAYISVDERNDGRIDYEHAASTDLNNHLSGIEMLRFGARSVFHAKRPYLLDIGHIARLMEDYLLARNTSAAYAAFENASRDHFGMDIYAMLIRHVELVQSQSDVACDVRSFHLLAEHKRIMCLRVQYLGDSGAYPNAALHLDRLKEIEEQSLKLRNVAMKYRISGNNRVLEHAAAALRMMADREREAWRPIQLELAEWAAASV